MMVLEVCIDCIESALAAQTGGAHRLEVCNSLAVGGTTPSHGLVERCLELTELPVMAMIRPHDGGFVYSDEEFATMLADIRAFQRLGVQGVVFGALREDGSLDLERCQRLVDAARPLQVTFHRAFDVVANPDRAFTELAELGIERLLTSGGAQNAMEGVPLIKRLCRRGGVSIIAAAGINAGNVREIVDETGVLEVHASASRPREFISGSASVAFGSGSRVTSAALVAELVRALPNSGAASRM